MKMSEVKEELTPEQLKEEARKETESGLAAQLTKQMGDFLEQQKQMNAPPEPEPEAPTNPFDPNDDPDNFATWEAEKLIENKLNNLVNERLGPVADKIYNMAKRGQDDVFGRRNKVIESDQDLALPEVKATYDSLLSSYPEEQQADPDIREQVLKYAKGENLDTVVRARTARMMNANEVDESPVSRPLSSNERYRITPQLARTAKGFGMDPQDYAKQLEESGVAVDRETL